MSTPHQSPTPAPYNGFDKLYINGRWVTGRSSHVVRVADPYDDSLLAEIPGANEDDLNQAFESAKKAQPAWAAASPGERAQVLMPTTSLESASCALAYLAKGFSPERSTQQQLLEARG